MEDAHETSLNSQPTSKQAARAIQIYFRIYIFKARANIFDFDFMQQQHNSINKTPGYQY